MDDAYNGAIRGPLGASEVSVSATPSSSPSRNRTETSRFYEAISHAHTCSPTKSSQHHHTKTHRHSLSGFYLISYLVFVYVISHLLTANCLLRMEFKFWFHFLKPFPSFRESRNVQFNFCNFKQISSLAKRNIFSEEKVFNLQKFFKNT